MNEIFESDFDQAGDEPPSPAAAAPSSSTPALEGLRVGFWGKLGGVNRKEAQQWVRKHGGVPAELHDPRLDLLVVGAEELPLMELEALDPALRDAAAEGRLEIVHETRFWERLGLIDGDTQARRLYTPAMLAELVHVPVAAVRRWHRRGLIVPLRMVHRLPYFDFEEVATARQLAQLLAAGASPAEIERKLESLARYVPEVDRPLAQLSVIVEGKQFLLREGEGLIEPGGQMRFDFESLERAAAAPPLSVRCATDDDADDDADAGADTGDDAGADALEDDGGDAGTAAAGPRELAESAAELEEQGDLAGAAELYRAALAAGGPDPELCFQLAEVLYRQGRVEAASERYFVAIELDEDYVEARANLGCVLAEQGELVLAAAAFDGALARHDDYPDVHFHLARVLDELQQSEQAERHWRRFLALAPDSPWADEARLRLALESTEA